MVIKMIGIYKIINLINNKIYIGSSSDLYRRKSMYFKQLKNGNHFNTLLQRSFNKYGENNFKFEIIETLEYIENKEDLRREILTREQFWIDKLHPYDKNKGFNILKTAGSNLGKSVSGETRQKLRLSRLGKKASKETRRKMSEASKYRPKRIMTEETLQKISKANKGKKTSIANKVFYSILNRQYKHTDLAKSKISKSLIGNTRRLGIKLSDEHKNKLIKSNEVKIINITTGIIFNSIKDASLFYNIRSKSGISMCCSGKQKTCGGYEWKYFNNIKEDLD